MELRTLKYFVTVAEELNITRAAGILRISQPPLSAQIRNLEEELGTELFIRGKRHLKLTEAGQLLYRHAFLQDGFFHLVADDDVEGIGELIGLRTDHARLSDVDRLIELALGYVVHGLGEDLANLRVDQVDKALGTADAVLVETGYGLMLAHGFAAGDKVIPVFLRLELVKQRMSALMDDAVDARDKGITVVGGQTLIVPPHAARERMLGRGKGSALKVKANGLQQILRHLSLRLVADRAGQEIAADDVLALHNLLQQRHELRSMRPQHGLSFLSSQLR